MLRRIVIRRLLIVIPVVAALALAGLFLPAPQTAYAADPTTITNVDELQDIEDNLSGDYELGNNIDASATSGWNGGAGFVPISSFTGTFDGKGFIITGLYINIPGGSQTALFYENLGTIQNVGVEDATIISDQKAGILVGKNDETGTISYCYTTGSVSGGAASTRKKNFGILRGSTGCLKGLDKENSTS